MLPMLLSMMMATTAPADTDIATTETLLRAAIYDRNLEARTPEGFRLGVAFEPSEPSSRLAADTVVAAATVLKTNGSDLAPAWVERVAVKGRAQLYRWLKEHNVSALYVPEGMDTSIPTVIAATEAAGVVTMAGSVGDVERGLVVGARVADESKKLVINMGAAERCGVDFDAVVRQIAERVGEAPSKDDRDELRDVLERYGNALEGRNLAALRVVWPALGDDDEKRVVASFEMSRSHRVAFALLRIDRTGDGASARVRRVDRLVTTDGRTINAGTVVDISFSKSGNGAWRIESMSNATPPS